MLMSVTIKDRDTIWKKIRVGLGELDSFEVVAGILQGSVKDGLQVAEYATWNEFGTSSIPARPFMRTAFDANVDKIFQRFYKGRRGIVDGLINQGQAMTDIGFYMESLIKKSISSGDWAPNAEYTIKKKGGGKKPLMDTDTMFRSVTFAIRNAGETQS